MGQVRSEVYLYELAVDEGFRRRGIATALIRELHKEECFGGRRVFSCKLIMGRCRDCSIHEARVKVAVFIRSTGREEGGRRNIVPNGSDREDDPSHEYDPSRTTGRDGSIYGTLIHLNILGCIDGNCSARKTYPKNDLRHKRAHALRLRWALFYSGAFWRAIFLESIDQLVSLLVRVLYMPGFIKQLMQIRSFSALSRMR